MQHHYSTAGHGEGIARIIHLTAVRVWGANLSAGGALNEKAG
jgi:hypothetical protein